MKNAENAEAHRYDDIIDLPHHVSEKHPPMPRLGRAAQFSPFAALTGYEDFISEEGRLTDARGELDENEKNLLDVKLRILEENADRSPEITVTVFVPDRSKSGGKYATRTVRFKKIDKYENTVIAENGETFPVGDIRAVEGEIFGRIGID